MKQVVIFPNMELNGQMGDTYIDIRKELLATGLVFDIGYHDDVLVFSKRNIQKIDAILRRNISPYDYKYSAIPHEYRKTAKDYKQRFPSIL